MHLEALAQRFSKELNNSALGWLGPVMWVETLLLLCPTGTDDWMLCLPQSFAAFLIIYVHVDFYICKWIQLD